MRYRTDHALLAAIRSATVIPMPTAAPVFEVVLPVLSYPLRWRDWNHCALCGVEGKMTVDHIRPTSRGGWNCASNKQPLCQWCNTVKGCEVVERVSQYERILLESLGRQGRAHLLPVRSVNTNT